MKKQLKMFSILLAIAFSVFSFATSRLLPRANATYVEGPITQDTIWTLVDSPFVLSKDIVVYPNATLSIEPGVEVKFGGAFSLIISGGLYANGTDKTIMFTSNKEQPGTGDWNAIKFNGTGQSTLIGCFVAYGKDGIVIENGDAEIEDSTISLSQNGILVTNAKLGIQNSIVSLCNQNGINITDSEVTIQNNVITENQGNGISVTGNGQVTIQNNTIMSNGNGILLTGDEASNVNINQNIISANTKKGIQIDANNHTAMVIVNNTVSSNNEGFYILSPVSTYITYNSISYNNVGILYDEGSHTVNYSDIYGNGMGMDASSNATVNAQYNYWGDASGPYHESLNPNGRGNPVGGDGTNIDFIFFLTKSVSYINTRPTANLLTDKIWISRNEEITFFATNSFDPDGRIDRYFFDFGDGSNSNWTTLSVFVHKYTSNGTCNANLRVMDDYGAVSNAASATIHVVSQNLPPLYITVELGNSTVYESGQVTTVVYVTNGTVPVENATVTLFSVKGGEFTQQSGPSNANGYFVTTFTAPNVTETANVRICARASENGINYTDGSGYEYLEVLPFLSVQIVANPDVVKSEGIATVTVLVKSNEQPIANVNIMVSSDIGNISPESGSTDLNGNFSVVFTASQTTTSTNAMITAVATKSMYVSGTGQTVVSIQPKIPIVQLSAAPSVTFSEAKLDVTAHVEYDTMPLMGAGVTISATDGSFSATEGVTDVSGNVTFVFTAPKVNQGSNVLVTAQASMAGYAEAQGQLNVTINPRTFNIQITAPTVKSGESATFIVLVTCREDGSPVDGATVTMSASDGNFPSTTKSTDSTGTCTLVFNAPQTTVDLSVDIAASVTRDGYTNGKSQITITVSRETAQAGGGWPLTTILLIVIPIAVVVIVVVLIKLKIIAVSSEEKV
jgi:hypothetical protein